jgi:hypothetical protein
MDIELIKSKVKLRELVFSNHGEEERMDEDLLASEIIDALLNGEMLEQYPDTGRGESCLILGFVNERPIHVVVGFRREKVIIITV